MITPARWGQARILEWRSEPSIPRLDYAVELSGNGMPGVSERATNLVGLRVSWSENSRDGYPSYIKN